MHRFLTTTALALAGFTTSTAVADTITVCGSGCDHTSINAAIDAASDGDVMRDRCNPLRTQSMPLWYP